MNEFYYSVARARSLEARMLTPVQLERMAAAADFEAAFSVLSETPYADNLPKLKHPFDFEELCELELAALKDLMDHLIPGFESLQQLCSNSSSPLIKNIIKHKIDLTNIKTLLRCQQLKKDKKFFVSRLLESGLIDLDILINLFNQSPQDIIAKLSYTPYFPYITEGIENFAKLEKLTDDFVVNQFRKAKYLNSGVEPLVGFYLAKEAEIKTLRFILICKKNEVDSERIKERLKVVY